MVGEPAGRIQTEGDGGRGRTQSVVQVSAQAAPFLFATSHQPLARAAKVIRQLKGMNSDTGLPGEIPQEPLVLGTQGSLGDRGATTSLPIASPWYSMWRLIRLAHSPIAGRAAISTMGPFRIWTET